MARVLFLISIVAAAAIAGADSNARLVVRDDAIMLRDPVYFETGKPVIKSESYPLLDAVAATLSSDKRISVVEIQGHTDERGADAWNLAISQKRADAIYNYLVAKGVAAKRLRAKGYGETRPVDKGHNEKAWAKNRRMAFVILQRAT